MEENQGERIAETKAAPAEKRAAIKKEIFDWCKALLFYCVIPVLLFNYFFIIAYVPTGSMTPTVKPGNWTLALRVRNAETSVERGDVVVFYSEEMDKILFKRCIGLPGEEVEVERNGDVLIGGEELDEDYVSSESHVSRSFEVPEGCYLFFGDNRGDSLDARYWEDPYISGESVMGKAVFVFWPLSDFGIIE
ncbi:MAG TPA: signal peptidase I [Oscillospiraceae bacterium]|nr:signal peptidase I [Oscillospiraceae bacterium]HNW04839.1 signal peptidase I [Oscillospiraceae bacterium]HPV99672.1 signal peptidase I [Oscillospiraceae bacterium]